MKNMNTKKQFLLAVALIVSLIFILAACGGFDIKGNWKVVGGTGSGQMQRDAVIVFDGDNCNVYSPNDTYAFYEDDGAYKLDVTGLLGGNLSFDVEVKDKNNIELSSDGEVKAELKRVG
jgi:hypothetical protein